MLRLNATSECYVAVARQPAMAAPPGILTKRSDRALKMATAVISSAGPAHLREFRPRALCTPPPRSVIDVPPRQSWRRFARPGRRLDKKSREQDQAISGAEARFLELSNSWT